MWFPSKVNDVLVDSKAMHDRRVRAEDTRVSGISVDSITAR